MESKFRIEKGAVVITLPGQTFHIRQADNHEASVVLTSNPTAEYQFTAEELIQFLFDRMEDSEIMELEDSGIRAV